MPPRLSWTPFLGLFNRHRNFRAGKVQRQSSLPVHRGLPLALPGHKPTTPPGHWPRHPGHEVHSAALARKLAQWLRVPNGCRKLADVVGREHGNVHRSDSLGAATAVRLLDRCDAWGRPQHYAEIPLACECASRGRTGRELDDYTPAARLSPLLTSARVVHSWALAAEAQHVGARAGNRFARRRRRRGARLRRPKRASAPTTATRARRRSASR
jgi:hypothetical protein